MCEDAQGSKKFSKLNICPLALCSSENLYLTPNLYFQLLSWNFSVPASLRKDCPHPCSVPPILLISLFFPTRARYPTFHLSALYVAVHQLALSLAQAYISYLCTILKAMHLSPQHLRGAEHSLTCPDLCPTQKTL